MRYMTGDRCDVTALENTAWTYSWMRSTLDSSGLSSRSSGINSYKYKHNISRHQTLSWAYNKALNIGHWRGNEQLAILAD